MRLHEFRQNKGLVDEMKKIQSTPDWRFLREALDVEHPLRVQMPQDSSPGALARALGVIEGFQRCLECLDAATKYIEPPKPLIETFEPMKPKAL